MQHRLVVYIITIVIYGLAGTDFSRYLGVCMKRPTNRYEMSVSVIFAISLFLLFWTHNPTHPNPYNLGFPVEFHGIIHLLLHDYPFASSHEMMLLNTQAVHSLCSSTTKDSTKITKDTEVAVGKLVSCEAWGLG